MPKFTLMEDENYDHEGPLWRLLKNEIPKTRGQVEKLKIECEALIDSLMKQGRSSEAGQIEKQEEMLIREYEVFVQEKEKKLLQEHMDRQKEAAEAIQAIRDLDDRLKSMREALDKNYKKELQEARLAVLQKELAELNRQRYILIDQLSDLKNSFRRADTRIHDNVGNFVRHAADVFEKYQLQIVLSHEMVEEYKKCSDNIKRYLIDASQKKLAGQTTPVEFDKKIARDEEKVVIVLEEAKKKLIGDKKDTSGLQKKINDMKDFLDKAWEEIKSKETFGQNIEKKETEIGNIEKLIEQKNEEEVILKESEKLSSEEEQRPRP
jgi:hypothetical protein